MRPESIVNFENLSLAALFLGLPRILQTDLGPQTMSLDTVLTLQFCGIIALVLFTMLVSRYRSRWARRLYIGNFFAGLVIFYKLALHGEFSVQSVTDILERATWWNFMSAVQALTQFIAICMLFTPSALTWFKKAS